MRAATAAIIFETFIETRQSTEEKNTYETIKPRTALISCSGFSILYAVFHFPPISTPISLS